MKKILLILFSLLLTGCTLNYDLEIKEDLTVIENIKVLDNSSYFDKDGKVEDTYKKIVDIAMHEKGYLKYDYLKENNSYGGKLTQTYASLEDYINKSLSYKEMYDEIRIDKNENIITINSIGDLKIEKVSYNVEDTSDVRIPENVYFSIQLPFKVESHNADKVDTDYNVYYWIIDENTTKDKNIEISFNTNNKHRSIKKFLDKIDYTIILIIGIIIMIGCFINNVLKKNDENNRM